VPVPPIVLVSTLLSILSTPIVMGLVYMGGTTAAWILMGIASIHAAVAAAACRFGVPLRALDAAIAEQGMFPEGRWAKRDPVDRIVWLQLGLATAVLTASFLVHGTLSPLLSLVLLFGMVGSTLYLRSQDVAIRPSVKAPSA